jgi:iduronate 2-sulfatase
MSSVVGRADTLVYLIAGQSNADGRALSVELPSDQRSPQAEIPFYYRRYPEKEGVYTVLQPGSAGAPTPPGSAFGPEVSFGYTLAKWIAQKGGADRIAIVKFARGGSSLAADWHGGGTATREGDALWYGVFQDTVSEGLAALRADSALKTGPLKVAGVIWVQGESDINEGPDRYAQNLETFIRDIRLTYGADLPFFFSKLSVNQTRYQRPEKPEIVQGFHSVRKAQEDIAAKVPGVHLISTDGPEFSVLKDKIHFDAPGQQALGAALAQAVIDTGVPAPSPSRPASVENGRNNLDAP